MDGAEQRPETVELTGPMRGKFYIFLASAILIAFAMVAVALELYDSSGAAQIDLSRPGYKSIRSQAVHSADNGDSFESSGKLGASDLQRFDDMYTKRIERISSDDFFNPDALGDDAIGLSRGE